MTATRPRYVLVATLLGGASLFLVPWSGWLVHTLPCRYLSTHWRVAWAGYDLALAVALAFTCVGVVRRATWLDRAAVAAATLLAADAWFDVVTSRGAAAGAVATAEAVAVELPVALLCLWVAERLGAPAAHVRHTHHHEGALS
jgi:hypothetical protein